MPSRTCSCCLLEHQVVKAYSHKGPYEHIAIQNPANGSYVCELCRTCCCQGCGQSFLAPAAAWRKHLLFTNTAAVDGCSLCPECSSTAHPSHPSRTAASVCRTAAEVKGVYSRFIQDRGAGPGACAACLALCSDGAQAQQQQQQQHEVGHNSRYPTDPLPQQHPWQQHQHGFMQAGDHQGQTTAMSWPSVTASAQAVAALGHGPTNMPAQRVPVAYPISHHSTTISSNNSTVSDSWHDAVPKSQRAQANSSAPAWQPPQPLTAAAAAVAEDTSPSAPPMDWPPAESGAWHGAGAVCTISYPGAGVVHTIRYPQDSAAAGAVGAGGMFSNAMGYGSMGSGVGVGASSRYDRHGSTVPSAGGVQPAGLPSRGAGGSMNTLGLGTSAAVGAGVSPEHVKVLEADAGVVKMEAWKE